MTWRRAAERLPVSMTPAAASTPTGEIVPHLPGDLPLARLLHPRRRDGHAQPAQPVAALSGSSHVGARAADPAGDSAATVGGVCRRSPREEPIFPLSERESSRAGRGSGFRARPGTAGRLL